MVESDLTPLYAEFAKVLDVESAKKIFEHFKGQQVVFPQRLYTREFLEESLYEQYKSGAKIRELAREYGYSDRYIRKLLKGEQK